jgi:predicted ATPase
MIERIRLSNFKCFEKLDLRLGALNLFTGLNGMGKSTIIQALLLLHQSNKQGYIDKKTVCLNGDYIQLGTGRDVLYQNASNEVISVELTEADVNLSLQLKYEKDADMLEIIEFSRPSTNYLGVISEKLEYLNAERISPQTVYPKSSVHINNMLLGINGQYTAHYLSLHGEDTMCWDSGCGKGASLKEAVQYWLNEISPSVKFDIQNIDNTELAKIEYYFSSRSVSSVFRPTNIGFGITYVLPVIVALLKAQPGSALIIENPEAHLHPRGQRKIGELISACAANHVQVFIETHSDHILNGIRVAVKNSKIKHSAVCVSFFDKIKEKNKVKHIVQTPSIDPHGKIDVWPDGFFDEWEKALDEIIFGGQ